GYGPPGHPRLGWGGVSIGWAAALGHVTVPENLDEAAELNAYIAQSTDALFSPRELELLYRAEDLDWTNLLQWLPGNVPGTRLSMLAPSLFDLSNALNRRRRFMLTTESWDLIRPNKAPLLSWESTSSNL